MTISLCWFSSNISPTPHSDTPVELLDAARVTGAVAYKECEGPPPGGGAIQVFGGKFERFEVYTMVEPGREPGREEGPCDEVWDWFLFWSQNRMT
mmetsp:Transcript_26053/g.41806  ORF Transcript_26053/g.41806 Transcript_26053/m.41806 type:complete len:95 (-) Transcript_26053:58-342(-)